MTKAENPFGSGKADPSDPSGSLMSMVEGVGDWAVLGIVATLGLGAAGYVIDKGKQAAGVESDNDGSTGISIQGEL